MRLPVPGPRDVLVALERGADQIETLLGVVTGWSTRRRPRSAG